MRNAAVLMLVLVIGCLAEDPEEVATKEEDLRCDPFCKPDEIYIESLDGAYRLGFSLFQDAAPIEHSCSELDAGMRDWDCVVSFVTAANPCGPVVVECLARPGSAPDCNWKAMDLCH